MRLSTASVAIAMATTVLLACGGDKKPAVGASTQTVNSSDSTASLKPTNKEDDDGSKGELNISDEIQKACGLSRGAEAFFAFDSADVRPQAQELLQKLSTCFTTGPLAKRQMRLVGHADPRGDEDYNMVLGGKRADSLKTALTKVGMPAGQIENSSRGEMDATGSDEAGYAKDRRVDVNLGN